MPKTYPKYRKGDTVRLTTEDNKIINGVVAHAIPEMGGWWYSLEELPMDYYHESRLSRRTPPLN